MDVRYIFAFLCTLEVIHCWAAFKWTSKSWPQTISNAPRNAPIFKVVYLQDRLTFSCQTNKQTANVTLNYQTSRRKPFRSAVTRSKRRIIQLGQDFLLPSVKGRDSGIYTCTAEDPCGTKLTLKKGHLIVLNVIKTLKPEIIPRDTVSIQRNGNFIITCKTKGFGKSTASLLTWYRKFKDGRKEKIDTSITMTRSEKQVRPDHTVVDVEKLVFINFTSDDVGEYTCERKVAGAHATSRSVKVELKNACVVDCSSYHEDPYCGTNGRTYKNRCELYNAICRSGKKFEEKGKGECKHNDYSEKEDMENIRRGGSCPLMNVRYRAMNVGHTANVDSWQTCSDHCRMNSECTAWTYYNANFFQRVLKKTCYLKKGALKAATTGNAISGLKACREHNDYSEKEDMANIRRGGCKDDDMRSRVGFCRMWKEDGLCTKLKNTMREYCPVTCGLCG